MRAYCLKCKKMVMIENPRKEWYINKGIRKARIVGNCPICKTKVFKFLKREEW